MSRWAKFNTIDYDGAQIAAFGEYTYTVIPCQCGTEACLAGEHGWIVHRKHYTALYPEAKVGTYDTRAEAKRAARKDARRIGA